MAEFSKSELVAFTEKLSKIVSFRSVFNPMLLYEPDSVRFRDARVPVLDFIDNFLRPYIGFADPTDSQKESVLVEYETTYGLDYVYNLFPEYVKEVLDPEKVLRELFRVYTTDRKFFVRLINQLPSLQDPFEAPEDSLDLLAKTIGLDLPYDLPVDVKRIMVFRTVPWYKIKGTEKSFEIVFRNIGLESNVVELWSTYNHSRFASEPEIYPVIDGVDNILYDAANTDEDVIKYKTSFFDLVLTPRGSPLISNVVSEALNRLEEVRPLTRTLRRVIFALELVDGEELEDEFGDSVVVDGFPHPTDELAVAATFEEIDRFGFVFYTGILYGGNGLCLLFFDGLSNAYYDNLLGHFHNNRQEPCSDVWYNWTIGPTYDIIPETPSNLYYGQSAESDLLDVCMTYDELDKYSVLNTYYDNNLPIPGDITYSGSNPCFTYGGSDVTDRLEVEITTLASWDVFGDTWDSAEMWDGGVSQTIIL